MGSEDSFINPEIIEKITSDSNMLRFVLDIDDERNSWTNLGKGLKINFMLCDVVIYNTFAGRIESPESLEGYDTITIHFKPSKEAEDNLSEVGCFVDWKSNPLSLILMRLKNDWERKLELMRDDAKIKEIREIYERQQEQKSMLEMRINEIFNTTKRIPRKPFNRKVIFFNRRMVENLKQELTKVTEKSQKTRMQLNELLQQREDLEEDINKRIDSLVGELTTKYIIEKIESK